MITENDLRTSIDDLANEADPSAVVDSLLQSNRSKPTGRRVRVALPIAAAAAVAILALGVALVLSHRGSSGQTGDIGTAAPAGPGTPTTPCITSSTPRFTTFTIAPVPDLDDTITDAATCAGYRTRSYYTTSGGQIGAITLYAPGAFDAAIARTGRHVAGSGITGYYVENLPSPLLGQSCAAGRFGSPCSPGIAWQYERGAWATITSDSLTNPAGVAKTFFGSDALKKLLTVAAAVRPNDVHTLISPFRLSDLAGTLPLTAGTSTTSLHQNDVGEAGADLTLAVPGDGPGCPRDAGCNAAVFVSVDSTVDPPGASLGDFHGRRVQIGSSVGLLIPASRSPGNQRQLRFQSGHWLTVITEVGKQSRITDQQLMTLARGMTFAPSTTDSATWYPFNRAVPH